MAGSVAGALQVPVEEWKGEGHLAVGGAVDDTVGDETVPEGADVCAALADAVNEVRLSRSGDADLVAA